MNAEKLFKCEDIINVREHKTETELLLEGIEKEVQEKEVKEAGQGVIYHGE